MLRHHPKKLQPDRRLVGECHGRIPLFDFRTGQFQDCELGNAIAVRKVATLIRRLGFDPQDFADRIRNTRVHNAGLAALSYCLASIWLRRHWQRASAGCFLADTPPLEDMRKAMYIVGHLGGTTNTPIAHALTTILREEKSCPKIVPI